MSRAKLRDNSNAVSLFPFLAVLLCTMGALIVVLVCVTRLSREHALLEAAAQAEAQPESPPAEPAHEVEQSRRKLEDVTAYLAKLRALQQKAKEQLVDDQSRLSHLEDHIRRLQEKYAKLALAAKELEEMEEQHFDDRAQAERELARLDELIEDRRKLNEELREEAGARSIAYAIVPYKGPNGTYRRPIFIECRRDEVVLQPEGIRLKAEDFLPPLGPGNPLASALRAAREQLRRDATLAGATPSDPYPLILVRPDGIAAYMRVREAIESWDSDFGYEFVDGDWDLKFPPANPRLASVEQQAVETARARMEMLAAAAPRAYGAYRSSHGGGFREGIDGGVTGNGGIGSGTVRGGGSGYGGSPGTGDGDRYASNSDGPSAGRGRGADGDESPQADRRIGIGESGDQYAVGAKGTSGTDGPSENGAKSGAIAASSEDGTSSVNGDAKGATGTEATAARMAASSGSPGAANVDANNAFSEPGNSGNSAMGSSDPDRQDGKPPSSFAVSSMNRGRGDRAAQGHAAKTRGKDWAIRNPNPGAIAIRRTIHVVVRGDRLAILPESGDRATSAADGREIALEGPTAQSGEEIVTALEEHIDSWGIAGNGLYWRPVLEFTVGPNGKRRADDLVQLLRHSGMELKSADVASQPEGDATDANR